MEKSLDKKLELLKRQPQRASSFRGRLVELLEEDLRTTPDVEFLTYLQECIVKQVRPENMFSAIFGWGMEELVDDYVADDTYCVEIHLNNLRHKPWWVWGDIPQIYEFDSLNKVMCFLTEHHLVRQQDMEFITKQDARLETGRLVCTSWYTITKGEEGMTEYTSL